MQQKTPTLTNFFAKDRALENAEDESRRYLQQTDCEKIASIYDNKYRFVDKIPEYKAMLEQWMQTEKPHLNKDFKLLDVMQVLPLNRSYLSRIFNEAYGETFFDFIM